MLGQIHLDLPRGVRTYGPSDVKDQFHIHKKTDEILAVRAKIERIYSCLEPDSHNGLFEMGFCFGLMDPRTNILVNLDTSRYPALATSRDPLLGREGREPSRPAGKGREPSPPAGGGGGRGREHVPPRARGVKRGREPLPLTPAEQVEAKIEKMAQRSLDGLTAFLTCLFPYLPDAEARKYLDAAGADPLVAALLIIRRRNMQFDYYNPLTTRAAFEVALRCAAVAAKHPDPLRFVKLWMVMLFEPPPLEGKGISPVTNSPHGGLPIKFIFPALGAIKTAEKTVLDRITLLDVSWDFASTRFELANPEIQASLELLPPARAHMKRMLLAKIHGFYIQALGRLPKVELRSCYHRSMLMGGYCYGPLDPVSNIIVNTIWYEQHFPSGKQFEVSMISTQLLWRIVARSLYGLISFLCTRHQGITPDQAIKCLLVTNVYLPAATRTASLDDSPDLPLPASFADAYAAAGAAAFHCSPLAQSEFLTSQIGDAYESFPLNYKDGYPLSSEDIRSICRVLETCSSSSGTHQQQAIAPTKVKKRVYANMCQCSDSFWGQHDRITSMVSDALDKFNATAVDGRLFELHIIFGVNEFVSGPVRSLDGKPGKYNPWSHDKYFHSHINFLAVRRDRPFDSPTLFFAECGKEGDNTCCCVPVIPQKPEGEKPRCVYCEHEANRIIHPTAMEGWFHGRDEFDELFYLSDRRFYNNDEIIKYKRIYVDWVHGLSDGAIYLNYYPDEDDDGGDEADWIEIY